MNGFATALALWSTDDTGTRYRPGGLRSFNTSFKPLANFESRSLTSKKSAAKVLFGAWELKLSREFCVDPLTAQMIKSLTGDTEAIGVVAVDPAFQTWGAEARLANGSGKRFEGLALKRWEILIQSRRIVAEEITLSALAGIDIEEFSSETNATASLAPGALCKHAFDFDSPEVTSAEFPAESSRAFSCQIIIERNLEPVNFRQNGRADNHAAGPWDIVGQTGCRLTAAEFAAASTEATYAALHWQTLNSDGQYLKIAVPRAVVRVDGQEFLDADPEHRFDFQALHESEILAFIEAA